MLLQYAPARPNVREHQETPMKFMQIIEYKTSRFDEVTQLLDSWLADTAGRRTMGNGTTGRDRDSADTYVEVVVFPSYDEAMRNNDLPETQAFAQKMMELCESGAIFRNLDVIREDS
jgi:hypothetical protein